MNPTMTSAYLTSFSIQHNLGFSPVELTKPYVCTHDTTVIIYIRGNTEENEQLTQLFIFSSRKSICNLLYNNKLQLGQCDFGFFYHSEL
jgi:hypothetical protein